MRYYWNISNCRSVRFRWYQGHFNPQQFVTSWALDNVYIGMQCEADCSGHGTCVSGVLCDCDDGFSGSTCATYTRKPTYLIEDFEGLLMTNTLSLSFAIDYTAHICSFGKIMFSVVFVCPHREGLILWWTVNLSHDAMRRTRKTGTLLSPEEWGQELLDPTFPAPALGTPAHLPIPGPVLSFPRA